MSEKKIFYRKLIYIAVIVALLYPLSLLSQPATRESRGGALASLRDEHKLSQADLGEIDPSSVTMRLATLGLGNIAVNILWDRANEYKKKEDWISLEATLKQIVKLQPNFFKVWDYQAHNLSFNISAEFDDYHDRYTYIIEGIHFLREGVEKNESEPRLLNRIGWYLAQKIGRADEHRLYRRLFQDDWKELFHAKENPNRLPQERDSWLVSKEYFRRSEDLAARLEERGIPLRTSPIIFYSEAPKAQINYAETRELEGRFITDQELNETKAAWELARKDWFEYGYRPLPTSFGGLIRLEELEAQRDIVEDLSAKIEELLPGVREKLREERLAKLPADQRDAISTPPNERNSEQRILASQHEWQVKVPWHEVADSAPPEKLVEAKDIANRLSRAEERVNSISIERTKVNYEYWRTRGVAESEDNTIEARQLTYLAGRKLDEGDPFSAIPLYEKAWEKWRKVIDRHPRMASDSVSAEDLIEDVGRYRSAIERQPGGKFPSPFILQDIVDIEAGKVTFSSEELEEMEYQMRREKMKATKQN
jgi:hypothetical protein